MGIYFERLSYLQPMGAYFMKISIKLMRSWQLLVAPLNVHVREPSQLLFECDALLLAERLARNYSHFPLIGLPILYVHLVVNFLQELDFLHLEGGLGGVPQFGLHSISSPSRPHELNYYIILKSIHLCHMLCF